MIAGKKSSLKSIIESESGLHMSAYIENTRNLSDVKTQIREAIDLTTEVLLPVLPNREIKRFLSPVEKMLVDERSLRHLVHNFGMFRTFHGFRIVSINDEVEQACVVSDSFHVKPLLKWLQADPEFLLLNVGPEKATLHAGDRSKLELLDFVAFYDRVESGIKSRRNLNDSLIFKLIAGWLNEWLEINASKSRPILFISASAEMQELLRGQINYRQIKQIKSGHKQSRTLSDAASLARIAMERIILEHTERMVCEFRMALELNMTKNNIADIARAAVQGDISQLIVAKDVSIFGRIDRESGRISVNPFQLDHHDDDILDDLAQLVMSQGGEVIVVDKKKIPGHRPAMAITNQHTDIDIESMAHLFNNRLAV